MEIRCVRLIGAVSTKKTGENGPWNFAQMAYVVGSTMETFFADYDTIQQDDWGWGVFYPTDSNSVDKRCRWLGSEQLYDCPGGFIPWGGDFQEDSSFRGAGYYNAGNPYAHDNMGGGAGCHFETWAIDQTDAWNQDGENSVMNEDCQCNTFFRGDDKNNEWAPWVQNWLANSKAKDGFDYNWFSQYKAPTWALDVGTCWMYNPRDMINLQNQIYWARMDWSAQNVPQSNWGNDASSLRPYWGWNEVPMPIDKITNPKNWDAVIIKLPAAICGSNGDTDSVHCLGAGQQERLQDDLNDWFKAGYLLPGVEHISQRPGSYVVFVREIMDKWQNWYRVFYCENWELKTRSTGIKVVHIPMGTDNPSGACYAEWQSSVAV